jgi:acetyl-CoA carboxylase biotin carboxyl carrier protein
VRALLELAARHRLAELTVEAGDFKLRLRSGDREAAAGGAPPAAAPVIPAPAPDEAPADDSLILTAPMIGTFYIAPAPGEPPFVSIGDRIEVGQTVAIIEAMKIMNEIQADKAGVLVELLAHNGQGVEFGQPLFRLRP